MGSEISDFKIGRVPVVDTFPKVSTGMDVWNGTLVYVPDEWVGNNWKASGWQKSGKVENSRQAWLSKTDII